MSSIPRVKQISFKEKEHPYLLQQMDDLMDLYKWISAVSTSPYYVKSIKRSLDLLPAGSHDEHHQDSPASRGGRDAQGGAEGQQTLSGH
jgi:hypothetical protein